MYNEVKGLTAADAANLQCDDGGTGCGRVEADTARSRQSSQAGGLTGHVPLSAALSLLNKHHHGSPCATNSGRSSDQQLVLRPIVARFLESLPSVGKAWSFDTEGLHSIQNDDDCSDSLSCCSCASFQRPASVGGAWPRLRPHTAVAAHAPGSKHHPAAALLEVNDEDSSSTSAPAVLAGDVECCSAVGKRTAGALTPHNRPSPSKSLHRSCSNDVARCLTFRTTESIGSAPTPSPIKLLPTAAADSCRNEATNSTTAHTSGDSGNNGSSAGSRRGVFVGNLPGDVNERALVQLFSRCGKIVSLWIVRHGVSRASLGYGFVVFDAETGVKATEQAEQLDGIILQQQRICVRVSTRKF